jgi:chitodextrinase
MNTGIRRFGRLLAFGCLGVWLAQVAAGGGVSQALAQSDTVLGTVASQMTPGSWASLGTNNINAVLGQGATAGNQLPYAFSGAWDPGRLVLHFTGADHYNTPNYMTYDARSNSWTFLGRTPLAVSHGYDHNSVDPLTGTLYVRQFGLGGQWTIWKLPPGGSWSVATTYNQGYQQVAIGTAWWSGPLAGGGSQGTYVVYNCGEPNGQVALWNPATGSWFADLRNFGGSSTYHCFIEYSPKANVAVFGGGNGNQRKLWRLNPDRSITPLADAPIDLGVQAANVVADPVTGNFLVMGYGQLWELNPAGSGTWTPQTGARVPPSAVGNPGSPNFDSVISASISNYGVVMYVTCRASSCNTYLYKHAAGGGAPVPADTTAPSTPSGLSATPVSASQVNLSWNASTDNVGVAGYRVYRNGNLVGTASGTSYQDTGLAAATAYSYSVAAFDAAGNVSGQSASASATTLSSSPPPSSPSAGGSDFQTRCSQPGVVKCVGFDSAAEIAGSWGINPQGSLPGSGGSPSIDTATRASGNGSIRFVVPPGQSGGAAGSFFANFSDDLSVQFGENSEFYVQWRMRIDNNFYAATRGLVGMKHAIIGTGSRPGAPASSCTDLEIVTQNNGRRGFPQMYHSCAGGPVNYEPFEEPFGSFDFKLQNARPAPYCLYSQGQTNPVSYFPPTGNCFAYFANEWMTFQVHVKVGPRQQKGGNWFFVGSLVELWLAREGRPSELVISYTRDLEATDPAQKYGQIWLLPYSGSDVYPSGGTVWYDELVISRTRIADPGGSAPPTSADTTAPSTPTGLTATPVSTSQVSLAWTASTDNVGVAGYRVYRNGVQVGTTSALTYQDSGLTAGTSYTYRVAAFDAAGNVSAQSASASATTLASGGSGGSTPTSFTLTVTRSGNGTVTSSPGSINCGTTCSGTYASGTTVRLTATPASGYVFSGWSGDADCSDGTVTMNASKTCRATFTAQGTSPSAPPPGGSGGVVFVTAPGPGPGQPARIRGFTATGAKALEFLAYPEDVVLGANVAFCDVDGDGVKDIITGPGPGPGLGPHVKGFRIDGSPIPGLSFLAYEAGVGFGVNVACGDLDGDGKAEIITGPGPGSGLGAHVRAFTYDPVSQKVLDTGISFLAYPVMLGVNVAAGDLDGDGRAEIITGPGPGSGLGAHVRAFRVDTSGGIGRWTAAPTEVSFLAYPPGIGFGVNVAAADLDGDGRAEIITGPGPGPGLGAHVRAFRYDPSQPGGVSDTGVSFLAYPADVTYGVRVGSADVDGDGRAEILVGPGPGAGLGAQVRAFRLDTTRPGGVRDTGFNLDAYPEYRYGVRF